MDKIDLQMKSYEGAVPGASLLVVRDGKAIIRRSYGLANLEGSVAATPETNFRLASVTKQFTATAILLLVQDGKLKLDDRIRKWLPSLPPAVDSVSITHLLTHTSGIVDYEDVIPEGTKTQVHDADVLRLLESQDSTYFKPGSSYRYSNSGYSLLSLIVERASGMTFAKFLNDRIFVPLGMTHTVAYEEGISTVANRAFGYTTKDGKWTRKDQSVTSAVLGDGGIYSSIDDRERRLVRLIRIRALPAPQVRIVLLEVPLEPHRLRVPLERQNVRRNPIEKPPIVRDHHRAPREIEQALPRAPRSVSTSRSFVGSSSSSTLPPDFNSFARCSRFRSPPDRSPTFFC